MDLHDLDIEPEWFARAFGPFYPILYPHRDLRAAKREAAFAAQVLHIHASDVLLDLGCGMGRHLAHLVKCVRTAVGLDYSVPMLALARQYVGPAAHFVQGDMRALPFSSAFDCVTSFFTSFGYFAREEENHRVLSEVFRSLRPCGRFLLDYLNPTQVRETLVPKSERKHGAFRIMERRWIDEKEQRINKRADLWQEDVHVACVTESVALYDASILQAMLEETGFAVEAVYGDYAPVPLTAHSPRMIFVATKH